MALLEEVMEGHDICDRAEQERDGTALRGLQERLEGEQGKRVEALKAAMDKEEWDLAASLIRDHRTVAALLVRVNALLEHE